MSRISALKSKVDKLRVEIIGLQMSPDYKHLQSLNNEILELKQEGQCKQVTIDSLAYRVSHRFSIGYVQTLDKKIDGLKQELKSKQITIDALEFDVDRTEKRLLGADEIITKLGKEIELLKIRQQCSKDDIANLVKRLHRSSINLKDAHESIVTLNKNIKSSEDKKIKNRFKRLFSS
jgi:chromosome segregation ATPase